MGNEILNPINTVVNGFLGYLPELLAGISLVLLGLLCAWIVKRIIIQFALILRLDRLLARSRWRDQFKKADVRHGVFALVGNGAFALVLLIFLDNALIAWKFTVLSDLLGQAILFLPRFLIAVLIFWAGWYLANLVQRHVARILNEEGIGSATFFSRLIRLLLIFIFASMAIVVLNVAREIVLIGFTVIMVTVGAVAIVAATSLPKSLARGRKPSSEEGSGGASPDGAEG